jgi:hypothetical protein
MDLFDQDRADYPDGLPHLPTPNDDECLEPELMRWFGWMPARAEDVGKIVHELEPAGLHHTEGYEPIQRRCVLALDLKHGPSRCFVRK